MFMDIFNVQEGVVNSLMQIYTNELVERYQYVGILYLNIIFNICENFDDGRETVDGGQFYLYVSTPVWLVFLSNDFYNSINCNFR